LAELRRPESARPALVAEDDRIRECSAMTALLPTVEGADSEGLREVRRRARELFTRSRGLYGSSHTCFVPPTRAELDELWALVPPERECWARGLVDHLVENSRRWGLTATVQTFTPKRTGVSE
jgi:hypothetical protein